jgi:hypothetical protein
MHFEHPSNRCGRIHAKIQRVNPGARAPKASLYHLVMSGQVSADIKAIEDKNTKPMLPFRHQKHKRHLQAHREAWNQNIASGDPASISSVLNDFMFA